MCLPGCPGLQSHQDELSFISRNLDCLNNNLSALGNGHCFTKRAWLALLQMKYLRTYTIYLMENKTAAAKKAKRCIYSYLYYFVEAKDSFRIDLPAFTTFAPGGCVCPLAVAPFAGQTEGELGFWTLELERQHDTGEQENERGAHDDRRVEGCKEKGD